MRRWPIPGMLRAYSGMSLPSASNLTKAPPGNGGLSLTQPKNGLEETMVLIFNIKKLIAFCFWSYSATIF